MEVVNDVFPRLDPFHLLPNKRGAEIEPAIGPPDRVLDMLRVTISIWNIGRFHPTLESGNNPALRFRHLIELSSRFREGWVELRHRAIELDREIDSLLGQLRRFPWQGKHERGPCCHSRIVGPSGGVAAVL